MEGEIVSHSGIHFCNNFLDRFCKALVLWMSFPQKQLRAASQSKENDHQLIITCLGERLLFVVVLFVFVLLIFFDFFFFWGGGWRGSGYFILKLYARHIVYSTSKIILAFEYYQ